MKKIISFALIFVLLFSTISFGLELKDTAEYLKEQELDEWGILAMYSQGEDVKDIELEVIESRVTTDYEAYVMGALAQGNDISKEIEVIKNSQLSNGKFADFVDGTGEDLINAHIWGIISLYSAGEEEFDKAKALEWLKKNQNEDGGFSIYTGDLESDLDITAMALVAYKALGLSKESEEVKRGLSFINESIGMRENCESIAWNIMSKISVGVEIDKELYDKLLEYKLDDNSFKHVKSMTKGNYMATWHGLLALSDYNNKVSIFDKLHKLNAISINELSNSEELLGK
ncbi:prenyltransferase/squalene oxidase repeat-containing protein [Wukongibacter sp. M2B1]|uniref:prenyltransferase/squalene oxidase repeat-containing protein n=1 Tax=Wukongibacter sp. M2B1 TaxID=3088895 RepID=UPI003D7B58E6